VDSRFFRGLRFGQFDKKNGVPELGLLQLKRIGTSPAMSSYIEHMMQNFKLFELEFALDGERSAQVT
jgi:hypothetical protein